MIHLPFPRVINPSAFEFWGCLRLAVLAIEAYLRYLNPGSSEGEPNSNEPVSENWAGSCLICFDLGGFLPHLWFPAHALLVQLQIRFSPGLEVSCSAL